MTRKRRRRSLRRLMRRLFGRSSPPAPPESPPDEESALVPLHPRRPLGSGSVALELPDEPADVDARGRETA